MKSMHLKKYHLSVKSLIISLMAKFINTPTWNPFLFSCKTLFQSPLPIFLSCSWEVKYEEKKWRNIHNFMCPL